MRVRAQQAGYFGGRQWQAGEEAEIADSENTAEFKTLVEQGKVKVLEHGDQPGTPKPAAKPAAGRPMTTEGGPTKPSGG
jgi:hypothetical protein